jgi:3-oxoacyl-[acyl-carrier-protein] synthase-1
VQLLNLRRGGAVHRPPCPARDIALQPLVLSHLSIVTSLGAGLRATATALEAGRSGLRPCAFDGETLATQVGRVAALDDARIDGALAAYDCRNNRLAALALAEDDFADKLAAAAKRYGPARIGVFLGTSTAGLFHTENAYRRRDPVTGALPADYVYATTHNTYSIGDFVRRSLRLEGPAMVAASACATTAKIFANAARMIAAGLCDAAVVGGADTLCATTLYGFGALGVLSPEPCRPFDAGRSGISIGEAGAFALLEKPEATAADGDAILLLGVGETSDAYHMSAPHPEGIGARRAMERALASAGLRAGDIDHVNLHGTATPVGDAAEDRAVFDLFGTAVPCSSTKGYTGHTLGAAGIVEAVIACLCIRGSLMPGSPHTRSVDPSFRSQYVARTREGRINRVISNSFGFGGANCSLVLGRSR